MRTPWSDLFRLQVGPPPSSACRRGRRNARRRRWPRAAPPDRRPPPPPRRMSTFSAAVNAITLTGSGGSVPAPVAPVLRQAEGGLQQRISWPAHPPGPGPMSECRDASTRSGGAGWGLADRAPPRVRHVGRADDGARLPSRCRSMSRGAAAARGRPPGAHEFVGTDPSITAAANARAGLRRQRARPRPRATTGL